MKRSIRAFTVAAVGAALAAGFLAIGTPTLADPPARVSKTVEMTCKNGYRGSAGGQYGGVPFSIACNYDRQAVVIDGVDGTVYSIRMGVETFSGAVDCFFSGDSPRVQESCTEVKITVR